MILTREITGPIAREYISTKFENFFSYEALNYSSQLQSDASVTLSEYLACPKSIDDICNDFGLHRAASHRFLKSLSCLGLVKIADNKYQSTMKSKTECTSFTNKLFEWFDAPNDKLKKFSSIKEINQSNIGLDFLSDLMSAEIVMDESELMFLWYYRFVVSRYLAPNVIFQALVSGKSQVRNALGVNSDQIFDLYDQEFLLLDTYSNGFSAINRNSNEQLARRLSFMSGRVLDVGGGVGALASAILNENSQVKLIDIYEIETSKKIFSETEKKLTCLYNSKIKWIFGDLFADNNECLINLNESNLYDNIVLSWILHDWDDETCINILKKLRHNISTDGKIIVVEGIKNNDVSFLNVVDFVMLLMADGKERTLEEYTSIYDRAGYECTNIIRSDQGRDSMILKMK